MSTFITALHVFLCLALISVVLLQHGKGADIGAAFGGGSSNTVFGARGAGNFLTKLTTGCVILFMLTSVTLGYFSAPRTVSEIVGDTPTIEAPIEPEIEVPSSFPEAEPIGESGAEAPAGFEAIPAPPSGEGNADE